MLDEIENAINKLKKNKTADPFGIVAEHLLYADSKLLISMLTEIYNQIFEDKDTPSLSSYATLIPLVKSYKKSLKSVK